MPTRRPPRSDPSEESWGLIWILLIMAFAFTLKLLPEYLALRSCRDCVLVESTLHAD